MDSMSFEMGQTGKTKRKGVVQATAFQIIDELVESAIRYENKHDTPPSVGIVHSYFHQDIPKIQEQVGKKGYPMFIELGGVDYPTLSNAGMVAVGRPLLDPGQPAETKTHEKKAAENRVRPKTEVVESSWIEKIRYYPYGDGDPDGTLVVYTKSGGSYWYIGVSEAVYKNFVNAESQGKFYNELIAGRYDLMK